MQKIFLELKKGPKYRYDEVIKARIGPTEVALGFSAGIFTGLLAIPILNLIVLLLAIAVLKINKLAAFLGYVLLLWPTSPFVYYASLKIGLFMFEGGEIGPISNIGFGIIKQYGIAFVVGNLVLATMMAIPAFIAAYSCVKIIEVIKKKKAAASGKAK